MLDTAENIMETVEQMHQLMEELNIGSEEYKDMDLSYLDDEIVGNGKE